MTRATSSTGSSTLRHRLVAWLGSTRLAVVLFGVLGAVVMAAHLHAQVPGWWVAGPLAALSLNLAASMATHPRLRQGGLGLFHLALLACMLLAAWGRLAHVEGRVELGEDAEFDPGQVEITSAGPWADDRWRALRFTQRGFEVQYAPGVRRGATSSRVDVQGEPRTVGDDRPLRLDGYRFYTTHNKGFAPLLRWTPPGGPAMVGALHLPSYPLNDWQQAQTWAPPGGPSMRFWLRLDQPVPEDRAWALEPARQRAALVVEWAGTRHELAPGQAMPVALGGRTGELRFERLGGWMGYRLHHDPAMLPLFWTAVAGVLGLAWHLWRPTPAAARRRQSGEVPSAKEQVA